MVGLGLGRDASVVGDSVIESCFVKKALPSHTLQSRCSDSQNDHFNFFILTKKSEVNSFYKFKKKKKKKTAQKKSPAFKIAFRVTLSNPTHRLKS